MPNPTAACPVNLFCSYATEKLCMDVFQITKSIFCLMTALVKMVQFQIQTKMKKNRKRETKTKTGKDLARETKILHPARNTASSFQTGNTHCLQKNHWRQEMVEVPQNLPHCQPNVEQKENTRRGR